MNTLAACSEGDVSYLKAKGVPEAVDFAVGKLLEGKPEQVLPAIIDGLRQYQRQAEDVAVPAFVPSEEDPSATYDYDLITIGAGSGGVRGSRIAASYGVKVALIEPQMVHGPPNYSAVGGTCVNVGCVPKKLMVYGSHYSSDMADARAYGWDIPEGTTHDWTRLCENKNKEISRLNGIYEGMLKRAGVEMVVGRGALVDRHTVAVTNGTETKTITARNILIAVGGWPAKPTLPGIEHAITSNEAFYLPNRPKHVVIVGGGYIAVEFACIFAGYGSKVTLMYRGALFLRGFDDDVRAVLRDNMAKQGIDLQFNTNPAKIDKQGADDYVITTEAGATVNCDLVMYATGRKALVEGLGLEKVGVVQNRAGGIQVDAHSRTNVDNVYAVGDVTDRIALTPVALHEGQCFAETVFGKLDRRPCHEWVASAVFSQPPIGSVGYTEEQAAKKYSTVAVYKSSFRPMVHTMTLEDKQTFMKLLVEVDTDRVVGVHMVGPDAAEILQGVGIAVKMGARKSDFDSTIGIHPSAAEEFVTMRVPSHFYKNGAKVDKL